MPSRFDPFDDLFAGIKNGYDKADRFFDARLDALGIKTLDDAADHAIKMHRMAVTASPGNQESLFSWAESACRQVMMGACEAPNGIDATHHIDRIMRLVDYRIEGMVIRIDIEDVMLLETSEERQAAFAKLLGNIED